ERRGSLMIAWRSSCSRSGTYGPLSTVSPRPMRSKLSAANPALARSSATSACCNRSPRVPPEITTGLPSPNLSYAMTVPSGDLTFSDIRTSYQVRLGDLLEPNLWPRVVYSQFPGRNRDTTHEVMSRQMSWGDHIFVGGQLTGRNGFTYLISGALGRLLIGGRHPSQHRVADFQGSM